MVLTRGMKTDGGVPQSMTYVVVFVTAPKKPMRLSVKRYFETVTNHYLVQSPHLHPLREALD